ncbi:MAG: PilZ domain-containing protein [Spirochaetes bacterium]|nr:MAG: PilZ domain-containing protein [Spirochaetota bacterium]
MKVLLIIEKDSTRETIIEHLSPRGFDFIHYINPVKAIDNILEISPDMVIFSAVDYPRHWKPFLKVLRLFRNREESIFILLKGENFPVEESTKATILEVNGIIPDDLKDPLVIQQLEDIFTRYNVLDDNRLDRRYIGHAAEDIEFIFSHPVTLTIISGTITDISLNGLCFKPEIPRLTQDIMEGIVLENCTLRVKNSFYNLSVRVVRNNVQLSFKFLEPSESLSYNLLEYFNSIPKLELDKILHQS